MTPIYKRNYSFSALHFGTLTDAMYHPEKYSQDKRPKGDIHYMRNMIAKKETVSIDESYLEADDRKITLTLKIAIDFRSEFYIKEAECLVS